MKYYKRYKEVFKNLVKDFPAWQNNFTTEEINIVLRLLDNDSIADIANDYRKSYDITYKKIMGSGKFGKGGLLLKLRSRKGVYNKCLLKLN